MWHMIPVAAMIFNATVADLPPSKKKTKKIEKYHQCGYSPAITFCDDIILHKWTDESYFQYQKKNSPNMKKDGGFYK